MYTNHWVESLQNAAILISQPAEKMVILSANMLEMLFQHLPKTTTLTPKWQQSKVLIYKMLDEATEEQAFLECCNKIPALLEFPSFIENLNEAIDKQWDIQVETPAEQATQPVRTIYGETV